MPDEPHVPNADREEARIDRVVLDFLTDADEQRPWSIEEVIRAYGDDAAIDGINRLHAAGLVHRAGGFVFASRAAVRYTEIVG